jgi:hypothetical protein
MNNKHKCYFGNICNIACKIILPYKFPKIKTSTSQKQNILEDVNKFLTTDTKLQVYITNDIYYYSII